MDKLPHGFSAFSVLFWSTNAESSRLVSLSVQNKAPAGGGKFGNLPPKSPTQGSIGEEDSFGTRKARSSFGRGFFKIKNNKRTASAPNLGRYHTPEYLSRVFSISVFFPN